MNWSQLTGKEISVDGEKMTITDYCKTCKRVWAESDHYKFYVKVDRWDNYKVIEKKLKQLQ